MYCAEIVHRSYCTDVIRDTVILKEFISCVLVIQVQSLWYYLYSVGVLVRIRCRLTELVLVEGFVPLMEDLTVLF